MPKPVDYDSVAGGYDRRYVEHDYPGIDTTLRGCLSSRQSVLEVGCGTGHWVQRLSALGHAARGLEPSAGMARQAYARGAPVVRGRAEALPFAAESFQLVCAINAMHHFADRERFVHEALRVLRPGGQLLVVGMDPSRGEDAWFVYDYFDGTLEHDRTRYPGTATIGELCTSAGFVEYNARVAEHIRIEKPATEYLASGAHMRSFTSQLVALDDRTFEAGIERIRHAERQAAARGDSLVLQADLRLFATIATAPLT
ncbi:MAG: class I SAM-dependent methyltransferase [Myxococcales bacterium]|nr:class I SAM-dependent methyltransferase [Myxococcales bacterium]